MTTEYRVTKPTLPPPDTRIHPNSPVMDDRDMEYWLNYMAKQGWEFVSYGAKHWHDMRLPQEWWIFKRKVVDL